MVRGLIFSIQKQFEWTDILLVGSNGREIGGEALRGGPLNCN